MRPLAALLFLIFACPADAQDLKLQISSESATIKKGSSPTISVAITNSGDTAVTLVKPGDGSHVKWRTPVIGWSVISADDSEATHPHEPPLLTGMRCGNINPLKADEIFELNPGEQQTLGGWHGAPSFPETGTYRVVFYYLNKPDLQWSGIPLGRHNWRAMRRVKASTPCELVSNELVFTVEE